MTTAALRDIDVSLPRRKRDRYTHDAPTGLQWVERMPAGWSIKRIKFLGTIKYGLGEPPEPDDQGIAFIRATDIDAGRIHAERIQRVSRSDVPWQRAVVLRENDILVVRSGAYTGDSTIVPPEWAGSIAGYDMVLRAKNAVPAFLGWALLSDYVRVAQLELMSMRAAQPHLNAHELGATLLLIPPSDEQRAVAAFLDRETARIDELIAKKQKLIELLKKKRQALVSRAVTKGLDPNTPMKPSGIDWLGDVPAHWEVCKTKRVASLRTGHTPSRQHAEYWVNCTIPWFSLADVWQLRDGRNEYLGETAERISEIGLANSAAELLPPGTVVVSRTASIGFSGIMPTAMATTQDFVNWICGPRIIPEYLLFVFRSMEQEFRRLIMGSTHKTIYMPDVWKFTTPVPPIIEQKEIVTWVRKEKQRLELLEDTVSRGVGRLREYRSALITAAVTGQIDVRHYGKEAT